MSDAPLTTPPKRRRRFRIFMRVVGVLALLVLLVAGATWMWGGPYAHRIIEAKLQDIVSGHLNARLSIGRMEYVYPYGVIVYDTSLVATPANAAEIKLASFKELRLTLAKNPLAKGPLVIERIDIDQPTLNVIHDAEGGFVGARELVRSDAQKRDRPPPKLSEVFQLRHLKLNAAQVRYEDRRDPNALPLVWSDLSVELNAAPTGNTSHRYQFDAVSGTLAQVQSSGTLDLDSFLLNVDSMQVNAWIVDESSTSPLPPAAQKLLRQFGVSGSAGVFVSGAIPLRDLGASRVTAQLWVRDARGVYEGLPDSLEDLDLSLWAQKEGDTFTARLDHFAVRSGSTGLSVQEITATYDLNRQGWALTPLRLAAAYTPTTRTRGILAQPATLMLTAQAQQLDRIDAARVTVTDSKFLLPNLNDSVAFEGIAEVHPERIDIPKITFEGLGGKGVVNATLNRVTDVATADFKVENLHLASVKVLIDPDAEEEMKGRLTASGSGGITKGNLDTFTAKAAATVKDGQFAKIPLLAKLAGAIGIGKSLFVAEDATVRCSIANRVVDVERAVVSSDVIRVRATGTVGFNKELDLQAYVSDAGDWKKGIEKTDIPVISQVGGALAGGTQSVIRGVMKQFTSLRVKGTLADPKITPDPAPAITDRVEKLFTREE